MNPLEVRWPQDTRVRTVGWGRTGDGVVVGHTSRRVRVEFSDGETALVSPQHLRPVPADAVSRKFGGT